MLLVGNYEADGQESMLRFASALLAGLRKAGADVGRDPARAASSARGKLRSPGGVPASGNGWVTWTNSWSFPKSFAAWLPPRM